MSKRPALDAVDTSRSILQGRCEPCPRQAWCGQTWRQQCAIPDDPEHERRYWELQWERVRKSGGVAPRPLPPVWVPPSPPKVTHILGREGISPDVEWGRTMAVYARNAIGDQRQTTEVRPDYLAKRELVDVPKVLVVSAEDD